MIRSSDRILTTHVGSLYRSAELMRLYGEELQGKLSDRTALQAEIRREILEAVRKQEEIAIDIPSDGEASRFSFRGYFNERVSGVERRPAKKPFRITSRDRSEFTEFYAQAIPHYWSVPNSEPTEYVCVGPIRYQRQRVLRDIEMMKEAMQGRRFVQAFFPAQVPNSPHFRIANEYYATAEEMDIAFAEALREEYRILTDAGFVVQLDDPFLAQEWEMYEPAVSRAEYRKSVAARVELLNHSVQGIPEDMVRLHVCWGSWHAPHAHDLPLADIVDLMLQVKTQAYSIEAANAQHEHEWQVWEETKLPEGKILIPGVVTHKSYVVEHPDLVAQRICRYAAMVGRENVIAAPDCGMGGRIQEQVGWAKLEALVEGARRASQRLWSGATRRLAVSHVETGALVTNKYRADHVGSLLRTPKLLLAREQYFQKKLSKAQLTEIEDAEIIDALARQRAAGLDVVTDGEYRRATWSGAWAESVEGLASDTAAASPEFDRLAALRAWKGEHGAEANASMVRHAEVGEYVQGQVVARKLMLRRRLTGHKSGFLKKNAAGPAKISMPGVMMAAAGWYRSEISKAAYPTRAALVDDMTAIVRTEVRALISEGIDYIQFDSLRYMWFFDPQLSTSLRERHVDIERELAETIASDNACIDGIPREAVTFGLHICRGNNTSAWLAEGGYDAVAEQAFSELKVDRLLLEYDTERAGGFAPLRFVRKGMTVVLGLISSKVPQLESQDELRRRVYEAARYVPIENLAISPQCGFASSSSGNLLTLDEQQRKLEFVVDTARRIWD